MTFWETFSELCAEKGLYPNSVCKELGFSNATATHWKQGQRPRLDTISKIADFFGVSSDYLLGLTKDRAPSQSFGNIFPVKTKKVPLLGTIACGTPIWAEEQHGEFVSISDEIDADFCLRASGDSMTGARIYDGDIVFCRQQSMVENGQIAAVIIGDEATLKRVYYTPEANKLVLSAENPAYAPLVYVGTELDEIHILGRAVAFQSIVK